MKKLISFALVLALSLGLCVPALAADFSDVPASHTFYDAIMDCSEKGIVGGYKDGTFKPASTVTRSNFCVMLSRAFYPDEVAQNSGYSSQGPFLPNFMALLQNGILEGVPFGGAGLLQDDSVMNTNIVRCEMAQLMTNIMNQKGFAASEAEKDAVISQITDYSALPDAYQDAVSNVYALGIITGYADGSFGGDVTMNRGQAAVVIARMMKRSGGTESPETPANKPTTVDVTSSCDSSGDTRWKITNNGYSTGTLNNGKPITQENVLAMLTEAKKIWPDGLTWADMGDAANNNFYGHGGTDKAIAARCVRLHNTNEAYACGGFAAMLSDYVFGPSSNPVRKLSDNTQVRPGDIVFRLSPDGSVAHVNVAVTTVVYDGSMPCAYTANGNSGGTVNWRSAATSGKSGSDRIDDYERTPGQWCRCVIYTRYPD